MSDHPDDIESRERDRQWRDYERALWEGDLWYASPEQEEDDEDSK